MRRLTLTCFALAFRNCFANVHSVLLQERAENGAEGANIRKAIAFLKETDGLLKIEDILPFFPDFALIDDFKEAICASLEDYNRQIEDLKAEMNEATRGADNIRRDIAALSQRYESFLHLTSFVKEKK